MSSLTAARALLAAVETFNRDRLILRVLVIWCLHLWERTTLAWERDLMKRMVEQIQEEMDREVMAELLRIAEC